MHNDVREILITQEQIRRRIKKLGQQISEDYEGCNLLMVSVLKGSVVFMADLMRAISLPARIDFMAVSSYGRGTKTTGAVRIDQDLGLDISGYDLLIVEDILDSGMTLT
jgi:hypoxanthine phosphoribosyltransferase